jgi:hypothetical protein
MYEANQEIRSREEEDSRRRQERVGSQYPMHYLDQLIEQLEEMNLEDKDEVPANFMEKLKLLSVILPEGVELPRRWPSRPTRLLDLCFELQASVLSRARQRQHEAFEDYVDTLDEASVLDHYGAA